MIGFTLINADQTFMSSMYLLLIKPFWTSTQNHNKTFLGNTKTLVLQPKLTEMKVAEIKNIL